MRFCFGTLAHEIQHIGRALMRAAVDEQRAFVGMEHGDVSTTTGNYEQALTQLRHGERRAIGLRARVSSAHVRQQRA